MAAACPSGVRLDDSLPDLSNNNSCWDTARVDEKAANASLNLIFGYGSLVWRPGIPHTRRFPGFVHGFRRRFWHSSVDHRGTIDMPGRVVTLVSTETSDCLESSAEEAAADPLGTVWGMLYELPWEGIQDTLVMLDIREKNGYTRTVEEAFDAEGNSVGPCFVYYGTADVSVNPAFVGPHEEGNRGIAAQIATCCGPSGSNLDYLLELHQAIQAMGGVDYHVREIHSLASSLS